MKHPKIPPNCRIRHSESENEPCFLFVEKDLAGFGLTDRKIIAAVAEVAWRVEAERLDLIQEEWCESHDPEDIDRMPKGGDEALDIALEWRVWGEQK